MSMIPDFGEMKQKPSMAELRPIPFLDVSGFTEKDLASVRMLMSILEDVYPTDATEDFHIGIQWVIYLISRMTEYIPVMPRAAILDIGIAAVLMKQKAEGIDSENPFPNEM